MNFRKSSFSLNICLKEEIIFRALARLKVSLFTQFIWIKKLLVRRKQNGELNVFYKFLLKFLYIKKDSFQSFTSYLLFTF